MSTDHYRVLQVEESASPEEIKTAFRAAAKRWHPDINRSPAAVEQFKLLSSAYEVIGNANERRIYDQERWAREITGRDPRGGGHHDPGAARAGRRAAHIFDLLFHPRVLLLGFPIAICAFMMFSGSSKPKIAEDTKVNAWFNPQTRRWETPAPWSEAFTNQAVKKMPRGQVYQSARPPTQVIAPDKGSEAQGAIVLGRE
jgi:curved DNA-binding protein CbpA